ncbi:hypothetical protein SAMN05421854_108252 [Amycolatopsis rubida]|uniref:Uncharacterized protein n=1 Tax=Amycolatopsis rubida TaxID=112413 RepID=A0A1I5V7Z3_9PSEU|nr:hypothetical protein SAMN05421854_108252 [Amycolatopsis rubida]
MRERRRGLPGDERWRIWLLPRAGSRAGGEVCRDGVGCRCVWGSPPGGEVRCGGVDCCGVRKAAGCRGLPWRSWLPGMRERRRGLPGDERWRIWLLPRAGSRAGGEVCRGGVGWCCAGSPRGGKCAVAVWAGAVRGVRRAAKCAVAALAAAARGSLPSAGFCRVPGSAECRGLPWRSCRAAAAGSSRGVARGGPICRGSGRGGIAARRAVKPVCPALPSPAAAPADRRSSGPVPRATKLPAAGPRSGSSSRTPPAPVPAPRR